MIIAVTRAGVALRDADDLKKFAVSSELGSADVAAILTETGWGRASDEEGHVAVSVAAVRNAAAAAGHASEEWDDGFERMLAYAATKGWLVDPDHILAHVEGSE